MKQKRKARRISEPKTKIGTSIIEPEEPPNQSRLLLLKRNWLLILIIGIVTLGIFGAGLKYLEEDAQREIARRNVNKGNLNNQEESFLNKINPFLPALSPNPTPQLSKELIYAGSGRLLAVEDANANAAPPADLAIWRPSSGVWWVLGSNSQYTTQQWGMSGDVPVPGDY